VTQTIGSDVAVVIRTGVEVVVVAAVAAVVVVVVLVVVEVLNQHAQRKLAKDRLPLDVWPPSP